MTDTPKDLQGKTDMEEKITLVDEKDNITGYEEKYAVHEKGLLHRAFSVFIVNGDKMLLQKRNRNKYHSGGLWSNACCSHQREGEELSGAVHRRMEEELGFDCELEELYRFIYRTSFENGLTEYELDHVFLGKYGGDISLNEEEAEETEWVDIDLLMQRVIDKPGDYTYWFKESLPVVVEALRNADNGED